MSPQKGVKVAIKVIKPAQKGVFQDKNLNQDLP